MAQDQSITGGGEQTGTWAAESDTVLAPTHAQTLPPLARHRAEKLPLGVLRPGDLVLDQYVVVQTLRAHETRRPGVFLCESPTGLGVVKIAALLCPPTETLFQRLTELRHPNLVRTSQTCQRNGYWFEVQEFCAGGTLAERLAAQKAATGGGWGADFVLKRLLPPLHAGLAYLHRAGIIHRDIKPGNIYFRREADGSETPVLGDFDISAVLTGDDTSRETTRAAGTWVYTAPEAFPRFVDDSAQGLQGRVTREADYYSLGITLLEAIQGTTSLHRCSLPELLDFYLAGKRVELPAGVSQDQAELLRGLTLRDRRNRWSAEEVSRWLSGSTTSADRERIARDERYQRNRSPVPYRGLGDSAPTDLIGLARALETHPEQALRHLRNSDILIHWVGALDTAVAVDLAEDKERFRERPDTLLYCAVLRCDPTRPFTLSGGLSVTSGSELIAALEALDDTAIVAADLERLALWLERRSTPDQNLAEMVREIYRDAPPPVWREELLYLLDPRRPYRVTAGDQPALAPTSVHIPAVVYGPPEAWKGDSVPAHYLEARTRWQQGFLAAFLRRRGESEKLRLLDGARQQFPDSPDSPDSLDAAFAAALHLLNPELPPITISLVAEETAGLAIATGEVGVFSLTYRTASPGCPAAPVLLHNPPPGLRLLTPAISGRTGQITLEVDARAELPAWKPLTATLTLASETVAFQGGQGQVSFQIKPPHRKTARRVAVGTCLGAAVFALPRLTVALLDRAGSGTAQGKTLTVPLLAKSLHWERLWNQTQQFQFPLLAYPVGLLVLAALLVSGWLLWRRIGDRYVLR